MINAPKGKRCQPEMPPYRRWRLQDGNRRPLCSGEIMKRHLTPRAVNRSRWFGELSAAIDEGERVLAELIAARICPADTERLRLRLIELRAELVRLNRVSLTRKRVVGSSWPDEAGQPAERSRAIHPDWRARRD